jgi:hypothetical protein
MPVLKIVIKADRVELLEEGRINMSLPASQVQLEIERSIPGMTFDLSTSSRGQAVYSDFPKPKIPRETLNHAINPERARFYGGGRPTKLKRKAADYIAEVFRVEDRPITTSELADLVPRVTGYDSASSNLQNTLRTAMAREEDRFRQYDAYTWGLRSLENKWAEEGKISSELLQDSEEPQGGSQRDE